MGVVRLYEMMCSSPESKELFAWNLVFAQASLREAYSKLESTIAPRIAVSAPRRNKDGDPAQRGPHISWSASVPFTG